MCADLLNRMCLAVTDEGGGFTYPGLNRSTMKLPRPAYSKPTLRRTSVLVTEWSQNWGHSAKWPDDLRERPFLT